MHTAHNPCLTSVENIGTLKSQLLLNLLYRIDTDDENPKAVKTKGPIQDC